MHQPVEWNPCKGKRRRPGKQVMASLIRSKLFADRDARRAISPGSPGGMNSAGYRRAIHVLRGNYLPALGISHHFESRPTDGSGWSV